jgi:hypothetical protein
MSVGLEAEDGGGIPEVFTWIGFIANAGGGGGGMFELVDNVGLIAVACVFDEGSTCVLSRGFESVEPIRRQKAKSETKSWIEWALQAKKIHVRAIHKLKKSRTHIKICHS